MGAIAGMARSYGRRDSSVLVEDHAHDVRTGVDKRRLAGDATREIRAQERSDIANFINGHGASQR